MQSSDSGSQSSLEYSSDQQKDYQITSLSPTKLQTSIISTKSQEEIPKEDTYKSHAIYVSNIPNIKSLENIRYEIYNVFKAFGRLLSVYVYKNQSILTKANVFYQTVTEAEKAIEKMDSIRIFKTYKVNIVFSILNYIPRPQMHIFFQPKTLYIRGFGKNTTRHMIKSLEDILQKYGKIVYLKFKQYLKYDSHFILVEFQKRDSAIQAHENLDGYIFKGNSLTVQFSKYIQTRTRINLKTQFGQRKLRKGDSKIQFYEYSYKNKNQGQPRMNFSKEQYQERKYKKNVLKVQVYEYQHKNKIQTHQCIGLKTQFQERKLRKGDSKIQRYEYSYSNQNEDYCIQYLKKIVDNKTQSTSNKQCNSKYC